MEQNLKNGGTTPPLPFEELAKLAGMHQQCSGFVGSPRLCRRVAKLMDIHWSALGAGRQQICSRS